MIRSLSILIVLLFSLQIYAQRNVEILEDKLTNEKNTEQILLLIQLAEEYRNIDLNKSKDYAVKSVSIAVELGNDALAAKAYKTTGVTCYFNGDLRLANQYYLKSLPYFIKLKDKSKISSVFNNIGLVNEHLGNYDLALENYIKCVEIEEELQDYYGMGGSYNNIANVYYTIKDVEKAKQSYRKAISVFKIAKENSGVANVYNNFGVIFEESNELDSALLYHKKALRIRENIEDDLSLSNSLNNIGFVYFRMQDYVNANKYLLQAYEIREALDIKRELISTMLNLSNSYIQTGYYDKAEHYLSVSLNLSDSLKILKHIEESYKLYSSLYSEKGDYKKSLEFYQLYSETKHRIISEKNIKNVEEISRKYNLDKKEKELEFERVNSEKLNSKINFEEQKTYFLTIGIIIIVLLLLFLIILFLRKKRINNNLLEIIKQKNTLEKGLLKAKHELSEIINNQKQEIVDKDSFFEELFNVFPTGLITTNVEGDIIYANPYILNLIGLPPSIDIKEINIFNSVSLQKLGVSELVAEVKKTKHLVKHEINYTTKWNKNIFIRLTIIPLFKAKKMNGMMAVVEDVYKQKQFEKELIKARAKAESQDKLKTSFLSNMSHEIRTPMNAIIGFASLLLNDDLSKEKFTSYVGIIQKNGEQLMNLINDIIDISKIEAGELTINKTICNLNKTLNEIYLLVLEKNKKYNNLSNINLIIPDGEFNIITDPVRCKQVMINLLDNSLKFTKEGKIDFGFTIKEGNLNFFVKDTGVGIPEKNQKDIFNRFYQADNQADSVINGTGLGLSIVKNIIGLLGGKIWFDSEEGKGTSFYYQVPFVEANMQKAPKQDDYLDLDFTGKKFSASKRIVIQ